MAIQDRLPPETIARLRRRYEEGDGTIAAIARDEGVTEQNIQALKRALKWRPRDTRARKRKGAPAKAGSRARPAKAASRATPAKAASSAKPAKRPAADGRAPPADVVDMPTFIARIRMQLEGALAAAQACGPDAKPADTASLMASLTRTLQSLRALEKDTTQDDRRDDGAEALPLDLAELRRELARRIDRLREQRDDP